MFKKIRVFLFSSLAALMAMNIANSTGKENSYKGLSYLSGIDNSESEIVTASKNVGKKFPGILNKLLISLLLALSGFNTVPVVTRIFCGKELWGDIPFRLKGFPGNDVANYFLDGSQILVPLVAAYYLLKSKEDKITPPEHYLKKLLLGLDSTNSYLNNNDKTITVINNYNYYNVSPEKKS